MRCVLRLRLRKKWWRLRTWGCQLRLRRSGETRQQRGNVLGPMRSSIQAEVAERKRAKADAALAAKAEAAEKKRARADAVLAAKADAAFASQAEASERKRAKDSAAHVAKTDAALAAQAEAAKRKHAEADSSLDAALAAQRGKAGAKAEAQAHFQRVKHTQGCKGSRPLYLPINLRAMCMLIN